MKKGFDAIENAPSAFSLPDSHLELGVGKNMGQAIRYWSLAFKIIEPAYATGRSSDGFRVTDFGTRLLSDSGWDPWLEDPASLWLLHWNLAKKPSLATAWNIIFNDFRKNEFSSEDLESELARFRDQNNLSISDSSLHKDANCILRMYTEQGDVKQISDENLDCPFVELGLIQKTSDQRLHQFRLGPKSNLPPEIVVTAALDFLFQTSPSQKTISVSSLTYGSGSPGQIFKLTESSVYDSLESFCGRSSDIAIADMAGEIQVSINKEPLILAGEILNTYYERETET
ncbi:MAG: DUF4007 family protein [Pyrinomonadaceae bacterium]